MYSMRVFVILLMLNGWLLCVVRFFNGEMRREHLKYIAQYACHEWVLSSFSFSISHAFHQPKELSFLALQWKILFDSWARSEHKRIHSQLIPYYSEPVSKSYRRTQSNAFHGKHFNASAVFTLFRFKSYHVSCFESRASHVCVCGTI